MQPLSERKSFRCQRQSGRPRRRLVTGESDPKLTRIIKALCSARHGAIDQILQLCGLVFTAFMDGSLVAYDDTSPSFLVVHIMGLRRLNPHAKLSEEP